VQLTTAATTASALAPAQLVNMFTLGSDGSRQFENISAELALWGDFENGMSRQLTAPGVSVATHTVYAAYQLDRITADALRPKDSALHTSLPYMTALPLTMTFGQILDMYSTPGAGVVGTVSLTVNVYVAQYREFTRQDAVEPRWVKRTVFSDVTQSAANTNLQVPLPLGSFYRGSKILCLNSSTLEAADNVNYVRIRNGSDIRMDSISPAALRKRNRDQYRLGALADTIGNPLIYADLWIGDGSFKKSMDLRGATDAWLELDVDATTRLHIAHVAYDPLPPGPGYARPGAK
jgi:hypothetical protein